MANEKPDRKSIPHLRQKSLSASLGFSKPPPAEGTRGAERGMVFAIHTESTAYWKPNQAVKDPPWAAFRYGMDILMKYIPLLDIMGLESILIEVQQRLYC